MWSIRIGEMKQAIENQLKVFLQERGMELHMAANDNMPETSPFVELEAIEDMKLSGNRLLFEIRVVLGLMGKPWQCDSLVKGIYYTLHPYNVSLGELAVLLMSIHVEEIEGGQSEQPRKRAVMRYIVEE